MNRFDRLFWSRLWRLAKPYWVSDQKYVAYGLAAVTIFLSSSIKAGNVVISYINRDLMTALAEKDAHVFSRMMLFVIVYNVVAAPVVAIDGYVTAKLMVNWRQWMTERFLGKTFADRAFYRISADASIDNPDQRVSEDLQTFATFTVSFVM